MTYTYTDIYQIIVEQFCMIIKSLKKLTINSTYGNIYIGKNQPENLCSVFQEVIYKTKKLEYIQMQNTWLNTWYFIYTIEYMSH